LCRNYPGPHPTLTTDTQQKANVGNRRLHQRLGLAHRSATVPADERPLPSVDKYDILLGRESS
jgi:hypothetical protein